MSGQSRSLEIDLDPAQLSAVRSDAQPLCVLASAGAGKTRVLTRRVARRVLDGTAEAQHTMVLTFTRKAAGELRDRLRFLGVDDGVTVGTFHAICFAQLRRRWMDQGKSALQVSSNPVRVVGAALERLHLDRSVGARQLSVEIAWAKSHGLDPRTYADGVRLRKRRTVISPTLVAKVFATYEQEKRRRQVVDYDDLLFLMHEALTTDAQFAATQRWKFRHFFVDEFQDLNSSQFALLRAWMGNRQDLFVVGDPNQAIYGWNGADASFLTEIEKTFPEIERIRLDTNYRSSPEVLAAAAAVLDDGQSRIPVDAQSFGVVPVVVSYVDEVNEATGVVRAARKLHGEGYRWADIAVLVRTNVQREVFESAFARYRVPVTSSGGLMWMREPDVRDAIEVLRTSGRNLLAQCAADLIPEGDKPSRSVTELRKAIRECLDDDPNVSVVDFLSWIEIASRNDGPDANHVGGVTLSTFHRAKGLEWPVVFLAGLENGFVPFGRLDGAQVDEERRLFYVAITRARERLVCSWAQERDGKERTRSPWLVKIERSADESALSAPAVSSQRDHVAQARALVAPAIAGEPVESDLDAVRNGLKHWRSSRAKLTGVAPELILNDEILNAIIDLRPATLDELADVEGFGLIRAKAVGNEVLQLLHRNG